MSAPTGTMAGDVEGKPMGGGVGGLRHDLGGWTSWALANMWLVLAWCGWVITLSGLSASQNTVNGANTNWALDANYPTLSSGKIFRFDWFVLFLWFIVLIIISAAFITRAVRVARIMLATYLAVALALGVISCNNLYNASSLSGGGSLYTRTRCAFAGWCIMNATGFALLYHIGLQPEVAPRGA